MIRTILLALLAAGALTYAIVQHWETTDRNAQIAGLNKQLAEARGMLRQAEAGRDAALADLQSQKDNIGRLTAERDAARSKLKSGDVAASDSSAGSNGSAGKQPSAGEGMKALSKMFESEEGRKMMKSQMTMMTRMQYADLARLLKLSPQDADQIMALLADRQSALSEESFKFMGEGKLDEAGAKEMQAKAAAVKKEYDEKLRAMLGEEKFQQMQDYEKTLGDRMMMTQYEQQFSSAGVPLQAGQRDQLLAIMAQERKNTPPSPFDTTGQNPGKGWNLMNDDAAIERYFQQEQEYQKRVLAAATKTLNPDQVNALQQAFQQFADMQKFGIKMSRDMFKQQPPAKPPTPVAQ
jgi:hypothetical protein